MVLAATVGTLLLLGIGLFNAPYLMIATYLSALFVGFVQSRPKSKEPLSMQVHFRILAILTVGIALYFAIEFVVWHSLKGDVTTTMIEFQTANYVAAIVAGLLFPFGYWITGMLIRTPNDFWHRIYVYARNGGYLGYWSTALLTKRIPIRRVEV
jgi:cytochrome c oxidase assembly factor CtaG